MKINPKQVEKYYEFLTEMRITFGQESFSYTKSAAIILTFKVSYSILTSLVAEGILERVERGIYRFLKTPDMEDAKRVYVSVSEAAGERNRRNSKLRKRIIQRIKGVKEVKKKQLCSFSTSK